MRPKCQEDPRWQEVDFIDTEGFYNKSLPFYFTQGEHTIRVVSIREPFALKQLIIYNPEELPSYADYIKKNNTTNKVSRDIVIKVQGEQPYLKSDPILYPTYDRTDPATEPYHVSKLD